MSGRKSTKAWGAASLGAVVSCVMYAMFAHADATDTECDNAWDDAPASSYCSSEGEMAISGTDKCLIGASSCSISVDVTDAAGATSSQPFSPTFPSAWTVITGGVNLTDTDDIDICFGTSSSGIVATVRTACGNAEVTSAKAKERGLSASG